MKTVRNILVSCLISIFAIVTAQAGELSVTGGMKSLKQQQAVQKLVTDLVKILNYYSLAQLS